jgi:uncharacterized protein (DUF2252 family)
VKNKPSIARPGERATRLENTRKSKMARSPHAYVRGNTVRYYEWLERAESGALPEGPAIWICGDCHVGNFGPVGNASGKIEVQIRDFDQTVIGNPAHDLIRLSLSLASAARGSDLPGLTTVKMVERIISDYHGAFAHDFDENRDIEQPEPIRRVAKKAANASWKSLATDDLEGTNPTLPIGKCFWPLAQQEKRDIERLVADQEVRRRSDLTRRRAPTPLQEGFQRCRERHLHSRFDERPDLRAARHTIDHIL